MGCAHRVLLFIAATLAGCGSATTTSSLPQPNDIRLSQRIAYLGSAGGCRKNCLRGPAIGYDIHVSQVGNVATFVVPALAKSSYIQKTPGSPHQTVRPCVRPSPPLPPPEIVTPPALFATKLIPLPAIKLRIFWTGFFTLLDCNVNANPLCCTTID